MDDSDAPSTSPTSARRLRRSFRLGMLYARTGEFVPFVSVHLARDGGVMIIPAHIEGESWMQGPLIPGVTVQEQASVAISAERPKLHYHRSGVVRASLTGFPLQAATSVFEPIADRTVCTMLSIVVAEPALLPRREMRKGDVASIEGDWPCAWTNSIAVAPAGTRTAALRGVDDGDDQLEGPDVLEPLRLTAQTPSQFIVDLSGYGHSLELVVDGSGSHLAPPGDGPSITIAAYPEASDGQRPSRAHALWNAGARNPLLGYQHDFLWEAERNSFSYWLGYVGRFNRLPPWGALSGTWAERPLVLLLRALRRAGQIGEGVGRGPSVTTW